MGEDGVLTHLILERPLMKHIYKNGTVANYNQGCRWNKSTRTKIFLYSVRVRFCSYMGLEQNSEIVHDTNMYVFFSEKYKNPNVRALYMDLNGLEKYMYYFVTGL